LEDAVVWYEKLSPSTANRFRRAVKAGFQRIAASPASCPLAFDDLDVRQLRIARFPYVILFRISAEIVVIEGLFHTSTDPDKWLRRAGGELQP
jgi:plasmid stabilization system protein ParE